MVKVGKKLILAILCAGTAAGFLMSMQARAAAGSSVLNSGPMSIEGTLARTFGQTILKGLASIAKESIIMTGTMATTAWTEHVASEQKTLLALGALGGIVAWCALDKAIRTVKGLKNTVIRFVPVASYALGYRAATAPTLKGRCGALATFIFMHTMLNRSDAELRAAQEKTKAEQEKANAEFVKLAQARIQAEAMRKELEAAIPTVS